MPESPTPGIAEGAAERRAEVLTPEKIEAVLADFRTWLQQLAASGGTAELSPPAAEPIDLHNLLGTMLALKQEVNLQTRAVRVQQEMNIETLRQLSVALEELRRVEPEPDPGDEESALRSLLKAIVDVYDAFSLARRELQRVQESVLPLLDRFRMEEEPLPEMPPESPGRPAAQPTLWQHLFGGSSEALPADVPPVWRQALLKLRERCEREQQQRRDNAEAAERLRQVFESVVTGYTMSLQRVERVLSQFDLQPIPVVGEAFDPERMEVIEATVNSGRPPGEVLEEVRRGYLWRGRVFRYAQVRVAKS
jgi:molecular chaperone GrpE